jgi:hypothetical protein
VVLFENRTYLEQYAYTSEDSIQIVDDKASISNVLSQSTIMKWKLLFVAVNAALSPSKCTEILESTNQLHLDKVDRAFLKVAQTRYQLGFSPVDSCQDVQDFRLEAGEVDLRDLSAKYIEMMGGPPLEPRPRQ